MNKSELEDGMQVIEDDAPEEKGEDLDDKSIELKKLSPAKVLSILKAMLRGSIYEDSDFKMSKNSVSIDLQYDSRYTRNVYINELRKKFPGMISISGTKIKIVPSNKNMGSKNDSGNSTQVKEDRRDGKSSKSLPGDETNTHQRKRSPVPDEGHRLRKKI